MSYSKQEWAERTIEACARYFDHCERVSLSARGVGCDSAEMDVRQSLKSDAATLIRLGKTMPTAPLSNETQVSSEWEAFVDKAASAFRVALIEGAVNQSLSDKSDRITVEHVAIAGQALLSHDIPPDLSELFFD